jgi:glycosyltransferase involved in cell wall biosynthesis
VATSFPEPAKGETIYTDLAKALHEAGHEITVVVSEGAKNKQNSGIKKEHGFDVLRVATGNYYNIGLIEKGITTLRIPILMRQAIKKYLSGRTFNFILFESPPVTNSDLVSWSKKYFNCKAYLMLKDIFPQNAVDLGIMKHNGLIFRYFKAKEKILYQTADYIGCMSAANKQYVVNHNSGINQGKVGIFPNTKKLSDDIGPKGCLVRARYGIRKEACVFLFGGNMGRPQYIDLLCIAIKEFKNEGGIYFLFVGRGTDRYKLSNTIKENNIKNALTIDELSRNDYEEIIKECDIGLIVLDPRFTIPNYPSRILSYMEYAKPVLAATDKITDIRELIKDSQCGEWVWSGDAGGFIDKIKKMAGSTEISMKGINGRRYLENHFNISHSVEILEKLFK